MLTSKKVRSLRLLLGLKQQELADITGLSFSLNIKFLKKVIGKKKA